MNEKKICFIICTSHDLYYNECLYYLGRLEMPEGYAVEIIPVPASKSLASGYQMAMSATDAKYKIYMHQDVSVMYQGFLNALLDIFHSDSNIGMIGMVGTPKMPADGIPWNTDRVGNVYSRDCDNVDYQGYQYVLPDGLHDVECVEGFLFATQTDLRWREDLFDGYDYADVAQAYEFRRHGRRVVVPEQKHPWCAHDYGIRSLWRYDRYRQIFLKEYGEYLEHREGETLFG